MKHVLLKSEKYLNNWGFCYDSGRYCHATQIEHLTKFELKLSILNGEIGLVKQRRPVFADYGKIMPKWYWNSNKKQYPSKWAQDSVGFDDPKHF